MNRQKLLVTACVLAAVSISANVWMWWERNHRPEATPPPAPPKPATTMILPEAEQFDFSNTGLADETWKLEDDKETAKPKGPTILGGTVLADGTWQPDGEKEDKDKKRENAPGPAQDPKETPPEPPKPQSKTGSAPLLQSAGDFEGTAFADNSWKLTDTVDQEEAPVAWEKPFTFEEYTLRNPATWEVEDYLEQVKLDYVSPPNPRYHPGPLSIDRSFRPFTPVFERRFLGGANNLRGWDYREAAPPPSIK